MCVDPVTAGMVVLGGGGLMSAIGAYQADQGKAAVDRANADAIRSAGFTNESIKRSADRRQMATQVAALSARGAALDSGSPLALQAESARNAELDSLQIRTNAGNQAAVENYKGTVTMAGAPFDVANSLMNTTSKLMSLGAGGGGGAPTGTV